MVEPRARHPRPRGHGQRRLQRHPLIPRPVKTRLRRIALALAALLIVGASVGAGHETLARRRAAHDYPAPGRLVDVGGGRRIQIDCRGAGSPTIVLEAGLDAYGALSWV